MTSFKEFHAANNPGNYVSVDVEGLPLHLVRALPGKHNTKPHITLMYSKESAVPLEHVNFILRRWERILGTSVQVTGVDVFDSVPKDGTRDTTLGCIVLKITDSRVESIHQQLLSYGMKHSYVPFSAHATLIYDCELSQCKTVAEEIKKSLQTEPILLKLTKFNNQHIIKDWAEKL